MPTPVRLQLSRTKGFRLQDHSRAVNGRDAVNVARPSKFGNPFTKKDAQDAGFVGSNRMLVAAYLDWIGGGENYWYGAASDRTRSGVLDSMHELRGMNLACWCRPGEPCHADVLLELANRPVCEEVTRDDIHP